MDSDTKDVVEVTWKNKKYYFDGIFGSYIKFCGVGLISGGYIGAIIGGSIGVSICIASPVIVGLTIKNIIKQNVLKLK